MARLYADENYPLSFVAALRRLGHDVLTAQEVGQANREVPDRDVLAFATGQGRAVLTCNRWDYIRLHLDGRGHAGIIVCSQDPDHAGQARKIHQELLARPRLSDQLIRIERS